MMAFPNRAVRLRWIPWTVLLLSCALLRLVDAYSALRLELPASDYRWLYQSFTCHLVHITTGHWLSDSIALLAVALLFYREFSLRCWLFSYISASLCISAGLLLFARDLHSYAGLSGVLHGLYVTGALLLFRSRPRLAVLLLFLLAIKLMLEPVLISRGYFAPGFRIAGQAHLSGSLGGILAWIGCIRFRTDSPPGPDR